MNAGPASPKGSPEREALEAKIEADSPLKDPISNIFRGFFKTLSLGLTLTS